MRADHQKPPIGNGVCTICVCSLFTPLYEDQMTSLLYKLVFMKTTAADALTACGSPLTCTLQCRVIFLLLHANTVVIIIMHYGWFRSELHVLISKSRDARSPNFSISTYNVRGILIARDGVVNSSSVLCRFGWSTVFLNSISLAETLGAAWLSCTKHVCGIGE